MNASTDNKCPSCGWPVYHYNVESTIFYYCTNPECYHIPIYSRIVDGLKHRDQMKRERHDWNRVKKAEPEGEKRRKAEEDAKQELVIENRVRRILLSYGVDVPRRAK